MIRTVRIRSIHTKTEYFILQAPHIFNKRIFADGNTAFLHDIVINLGMVADSNGSIFGTIIF